MLLTGPDIRFTKKFTTTPVKSAVKIVPLRVPTISPLKRNHDITSASTTQPTSNPILTLPNIIPDLSEIAFTKASPEFMMKSGKPQVHRVLLLQLRMPQKISLL